MNFWYIFTILGVIFVAGFGYFRTHFFPTSREQKLGIGQKLSRVLVLVCSIALCALIFLESWHGLIAFFVDGAQDGLSEFLGYIGVLVAPIAVSVLYAWVLLKIDRWFAELGRYEFKSWVKATWYNLKLHLPYMRELELRNALNRPVFEFRYYDGNQKKWSRCVVISLEPGKREVLTVQDPALPDIQDL